jgi:hypothetical protein
VFESEDDLLHAVEKGEIKKGEKTVVVLRGLGPKGGPGMPEMLKVRKYLFLLPVTLERVRFGLVRWGCPDRFCFSSGRPLLVSW